MEVHFYKYHGTGNDFILINNMNGEVDLTTQQIVSLCNRRLGIGSDGIILLEKDKEADYNMNFYNPDGSQSFCGNGSRCAFRFAQDQGIVEDEANFRAIDGIHLAKNQGESISILMNNVDSFEVSDKHYFINTGSPHYIEYIDELDEFNLIEEARRIRYNERFKNEGTNVNFIVENKKGIAMRTYERGVEDETFSCGTGVTAAALSFGLRHPGATLVRS